MRTSKEFKDVHLTHLGKSFPFKTHCSVPFAVRLPHHTREPHQHLSAEPFLNCVELQNKQYLED